MKKQNRNSDHSMAHVLYQKLGDQWYAFTEVDGDLFMGKLENEEIPAEVLATEENNFLANHTPRKPLKAA
jgi:hypothetical protein